MLRDTGELLYPAVCETIAALGLGSEDAAAVRLARHYANAIDQEPAPRTLKDLGPLLLAALTALGATPDARARITRIARDGGDPAVAPESRLDQLRQSRASRRT